MFRNVLVPVDGSPQAEHALPWALAVTGPSGTVHLVHVHDVLAPVAVEGMVMIPTDEEGRRASEETYLGGLTARVRAAAPGVTVTARNVDPDGPFVEALTGAVNAAGAELVVMTTHGRGPFGRFLLGSFSDEVVRHSPVPVLVVRRGDEEPPADLSARPGLNHLVVPLDGSDLAERIVDPAVRIGATFGADLQLVLVLDAPGDPGRDGTAARATQDYLDRVVGRIADRSGKARTRVISGGSPAEAILKAAGGDPATGIALATHGRSGLGRMLRGSVADEVIREAVGPVLVFHPPG
jgi:nucleotide-binding universal stress UspA family protein